MRIWSLHPKYLDPQGLVALWREALLAQKVLQGATRGYKNHPQLERFKAHPNSLAAMATYLEAVEAEASRRGYHFDAAKIAPDRTRVKITVTDGQLAYEWKHLKAKLAQRSPKQSRLIESILSPEAHPFFMVVAGNVETWERDKNK